MKESYTFIQDPVTVSESRKKVAILGIDKNGNVKVFNDIDTNADMITVNPD